MSEATHTPAPWTIADYGTDDAPSLVIHKDDDTRICFMATPGSHGDPANIEADARLIAAAPAMLAALKQIHFYETVRDPNRGELYLGALRAVEAAIALAEDKS